MTSLSLRPLRVDDPTDVREWANLTARIFQSARPDDADLQRRMDDLADHRITVVEQHDAGPHAPALVAGFRSWDEQVSLPGGGLITANAISSVVVSSTHKRRGLLKQWMTAELERAHAAGTPLSLLYASESQIYGRFGFGQVSAQCTWTVSSVKARFRRPADGAIQVVEPVVVEPLIEQIFAGAQRRCAGTIGRTAAEWGDLLGRGSDPKDAKKRWYAVHLDEDGTPDGLVVYSIKEDWDGLNPSHLIVHDLLAATDEAELALWQHCAGVDFAETAELDGGTPDLPLPHWLVDRRAARTGRIWDGLWARLHDVPAVLTARRYPLPGRVLLQVRDDLEQVGGHYLLEVDESGSARCQRVDGSAAHGSAAHASAAGESQAPSGVLELGLNVTDLATLAFGSPTGTPTLPVLHHNGEVQAREEDLDRLQAMFSTTSRCQPLTGF